MGLAQVLEWNRAVLARRGTGPGTPTTGPAVAPGMVLVACDEVTLDPLIGGALGIAPGGAVLLRSPAAVVLPDGELIRSLALAVYLDGVSEVLILGHRACRMAGLGVAEFTASFRRRDVPRSAFGDVDLRAWLGASAGPAAAVAQTVQRLRGSVLLPRDLAVAGLLLDDATGGIEPVTETVQPARTDIAAAAAAPAPGAGDEAGPVDGSPAGAVPPAAAGEADARAAAVARLVAVLERNREIRPRLDRLREELRRERNPVAQLTLVEALLRQVGRDAAEAREAFAQARSEAGSGGGTASLAVLLGLFRGRQGKGRS